jgi:hypothetical protein
MEYFGLSDMLATELAKKVLGIHWWQKLNPNLRVAVRKRSNGGALLDFWRMAGLPEWQEAPPYAFAGGTGISEVVASRRVV